MVTIKLMDDVELIKQSDSEYVVTAVKAAAPIKTPPGPVAGPDFQLGSGLPTGKELSVNGLTLMPQTPGLGHSLRPIIGLKKGVGFRAELSNEKEIWENDKTNKNRQRVELYQKGSNFPQNKDVFVSYMIKIEEGARFDMDEEDGDFIYITQFHASEDREGKGKEDVSSAPCVGLKLWGYDTVEAVTASATDQYHTAKPKTVSRGTFTLERGLWHHILIRIRFNPTKGQLQVWKNGEEVISANNIGTSYNDKIGPYWKLGIYRSPMPQKLAIWFANMESSKDGSTGLLARKDAPLPLE